VQQIARPYNDDLRRDVINGGYWLVRPGPRAQVAVIGCGAVMPEAREAHQQICEDDPDAGLLVVTSPGRLERGWSARLRQGDVRANDSHIEWLLGLLRPDAGVVTVIDGHPATLAWLGGVHGHRIISLGVDRFGQSGDIVDLYRIHGIDTDAIVDAAARLCVVGHLSPRFSHVN
jgi:pyruvate dehydrogenase E1 component